MERALDVDLAAIEVARRSHRWAKVSSVLLRPIHSDSPRQLFLSLLDKYIIAGKLKVTEPSGQRHTFGSGDKAPTVSLEIKDPSFYGKVLKGGSLGLGESYVEGLWSVSDGNVCDFLGVVLSNFLYLKVSEHPLYRIRNFMQNFRFHSRSAEKARECISYHYDLSNDFFALMLDPTMTYSCGYQLAKEDSLEYMPLEKSQIGVINVLAEKSEGSGHSSDSRAHHMLHWTLYARRRAQRICLLVVQFRKYGDLRLCEVFAKIFNRPVRRLIESSKQPSSS